MHNFTAEELAYMQAHIDETRVPDIYWIYCSAIVVAVISTLLRVLAKTYTRNGIALDDYLAACAVICITGSCIINFITGKGISAEFDKALIIFRRSIRNGPTLHPY